MANHSLSAVGYPTSGHGSRGVVFALALALPLSGAASYAVNSGAPVGPFLVRLLPFLVAAIVAYLLLRRFAPGADRDLFSLAVALMGLGLVLIARLQPDLFIRQLVWSILGTLAIPATVLLVRHPTRLGAYKYVCAVGAALLLGLTMVVGTEKHGARLWLQIGDFSVQPGEFARILLIVFLAGYLREEGPVLARWTQRVGPIAYPSARHLGPLVFMWLVSLALLIRQTDFGAALLFFVIFLALLYSATNRLAFLFGGLTLFAAGAYLCYLNVPHIRTRIMAWLDPWSIIDGGGYQIGQSLFALASGGVVGTGLGRGLPTAIPVHWTDFIFSAVGEELGLVGACAVISIYALLVVRGFRAAWAARDEFSSLLAVGLSTAIGVQALIIVAGVTKLLPMTGITLPWVSYGGSSLVATSIALGILLRLSAQGTGIQVVGQTAVEEELGRAASPRLSSHLPPRARSAGIRGLALAHLAAFLALSLWLPYWQVARADFLAFHPKNPRLAAIEQTILRGRILDRNGKVLAETDPSSRERIYPAGSIASLVVGYRTDRFGSTGIEASCAGYLLGLNRPRGGIVDLLKLTGGRLPHRGFDVELTIDLDLQRAAAASLGRRKGAVVVLEPATGEVLALVGSPSFDPSAVEKTLEQGVPGEDSSSGASAKEEAYFLNRATQGLYPPGSAFKIFVLASALESGAIDLGFTTSCPGEEVIHHDRIRCWKKDGHGTVDVAQALIQSCNIAFAKIGDRLGPRRFEDYARRFGLGDALNLGVPVAASRVPTGSDLTEAMLLESSFGQGTLQITPLEMALMASAFANGGEIPQPVLIREITDPSTGAVTARFSPRGAYRPVSPKVADEVRGLMERVVASGTGGAAAISGVRVAGKTGSAQNPHGKPHAWFVGFAPAEAPRVVVAVVVENGGMGGAVAAPMARELLRAALASR